MPPQFRYNGRYFGRRVNCEYVPLLPAGVVRLILNDPRKIPYFLVWKSERHGEVKEAVRVICQGPTPYLPEADSIEIKRKDGSVTRIHILTRPLPRNGGHETLLACPVCDSLRRSLYGWTPGGQYTTSVYRSVWQCRACAGLRYTSEGEKLLIRSRGWIGRMFGVGLAKRPNPWYPYFFTSPEDAAAAGFCM
jgi:hypothetical protein